MSTSGESDGRIAIVDSLRGWALLGVVLVNFALFYSLGTATRIPSDDTASRVTKLLTQVFFQDKGWTLLAFLFGYGFSVLIERLRRRAHPVRAFSVRMFWLFAIAILNCALYYGDVLKDYVLVGMVILAFHRVSARTAARLAIACLLTFPALIAWSRGLELANPIAEPDLALYRSSSLLAVLEYGLVSGLRMSLSVSKYFDWDLVMLSCAFAGVACQRSGVLRRFRKDADRSRSGASGRWPSLSQAPDRAPWQMPWASIFVRTTTSGCGRCWGRWSASRRGCAGCTWRAACRACLNRCVWWVE